MSAEFFLDTNVVLYAYDRESPEKQATAQRLLKAAIREENAAVSPQVLGEFYVNATRKFAEPLPHNEVRDIVAALAQLPCVELDELSALRAIDISAQHGISYWDALIIASALRAGCSILYSEDLSAGQDYDGVTVVNPFSMSGHDSS